MEDEKAGKWANPEANAWEAAYDVLFGAGVKRGEAAALALYAIMDGRDPVAWARKYVAELQAATGTPTAGGSVM